MLQRGTNIMANKVQTPVQNYFEKVLYENLTFEIPHLWFLRVVSWALRWGIQKIVTSPQAVPVVSLIETSAYVWNFTKITIKQKITAILNFQLFIQQNKYLKN